MATALTGQTKAASYPQLLHLSNGVTGSLAAVYDGDGTASALQVSTTAVAVDNLKLDGNTLSTTDTNGNLTLAPNGSGNVGIANAAITGGAITGITDLAVADGGSGASTASGARTNFGLGTIATQDANNVTVSGGSVLPTTALGYNTGAGGVVVQLTSKSTTVVLNTVCGTITTHSANLATATSVSFTMTNSAIGTTDVILLNLASGGTVGAYGISVDTVGAGSCIINIYNRTGGGLAETLVINFVVLQSVIA